MINIDLQSGEYRHRYGVGGEEWDETKHSIHAALNLQLIKMFFLYLFTLDCFSVEKVKVS